MATKFNDLLQTHKIDPRRLLVASRKLERLRPEDRHVKLAKRRARAGEAATEEQAAPPKPRSGKPVTKQLLQRATDGKRLSGAAKTRLLRAVNHLLELKKKDPIQLGALF
jgi:hypothetical protein